MTLLTESDRKYIVQEILAELERQKVATQAQDNKTLNEMAARVQHIANAIDAIEKRRTGFLLGVWRAVCRGWGQTRVEIDKLFKE